MRPEPPFVEPASADPVIGQNVITLEDGSVINGSEVNVGRGDTELVNDRWAVYRDAQDRVRAHAVTPRTHVLGRRPETLWLGDRAMVDEWEVRWVAIRDGLVALEGTHRKKAKTEWRALLGRRPTHELASESGLFHFEVSLVAVNGELDHGGSIAITGESVDHATPASYGQSLVAGLYLFPDGFRIRVERVWGCDFDPSEPCFGGTYRAHAISGKQEAHVEWKTRSTNLLGHRLELTNPNFVVRK